MLYCKVLKIMYRYYIRNDINIQLMEHFCLRVYKNCSTIRIEKLLIGCVYHGQLSTCGR